MDTFSGFFDLRVLMNQWASVGIFDVLFPILLIFVIIYAILHQAKILGGMKSIDAVVACIIAFFVGANRYVVELFIPIFSQAGLAIIIMVAISLIIGLFFNKEDTSPTIKTALAIMGIGLFLWLLTRMAEQFGIWTLPIQTFFWANSPYIVMIFLVLAAVIGVMIEPKSKNPKYALAQVPSTP